MLEVAAKPNAAASETGSKTEKGKGMLGSALKIIEYLGVYMDHNLIGSLVDVVGTSESQWNHTCKYHNNVNCGSQLLCGEIFVFPQDSVCMARWKK